LGDIYEFDDPTERYESYWEQMDRVKRTYDEVLKRASNYTDLEDFLWWFATRDAAEEPEDGEPASLTPVPPIESEGEEGTAHTEMQWMLARVGKLRGFRVHIAGGDVGRTWKGEKLGAQGGDPLPLPGFTEEDRKVIERIDVIWFKGNEITHMFEIESTTSIVTGLLRMSDLLSLLPHLRPALVIVAPSDRAAEAKRIMERPTFRRMREEAGGRKFDFRAFEDIRAQFELESRGGAIH
jgi:hypothetical protein